MEQINGSHSLGRRSGMGLVTCIYIPDLGKWFGYPKDQPHYQTYGESLEELQLKLHKLYGDLSQATPSKSVLKEKPMRVAKYSKRQNGTTSLGRKSSLKTRDYANSPQISPPERSTSSKKYGRDNVKRSDLNGASVMRPVVGRYHQSPCMVIHAKRELHHRCGLP